MDYTGTCAQTIESRRATNDDDDDLMIEVYGCENNGFVIKQPYLRLWDFSNRVNISSWAQRETPRFSSDAGFEVTVTN